MRPILFVVGDTPVYAYGVFLGLAFLAAALSLVVELRHREQPAWIVWPALATAMVAGVVGARLASLLEGGDGLNHLGGFVVAAPLVVVVVRAVADVRPMVLVDAAAPGLAFATAIARLGCHVAGDGDYGVPTTLPWGMAYPDGLVPTLERVHPTPLYEAAVATALGLVVWRLGRRRPDGAGLPFAVFLVGSGLARFLVEFIRRNDIVAFGLTQAQILSLLLVGVGAAGLFLRVRRPR
jgi:phosphatidylglycerol:prolipoprotein diacylglycerol transferase